MRISTNLGKVDRLIRFVVAILLISAPYLVDMANWNNPAMRWGVPMVGVVLVLTALLRCCPIYRLFGVNTCKMS